MGQIHDRFKAKAMNRAGPQVSAHTALRVADGRRSAQLPGSAFLTDRVKMVEAELKALKGKYLGNCNRTACQQPGAVWWNRGSYSWYCRECALMLNRENRPWVKNDIGLDVLCVDRGVYATDVPRLEALNLFACEECGA